VNTPGFATVGNSRRGILVRLWNRVVRGTGVAGLVSGAWKLVLVYAGIQGVILLALFANHVLSPEITRGAMYESAYRMAHGLSIYPEPTSQFVGVAYMPLFSVVSALALRLVGETAAALRSAAIVGSLGAWAVLLLTTYRLTGSRKFTLIAGGLFASTYFTFDAYLDYGNPDSWMLFLVLLGFYLCWEPASRSRTILGVLALTTAFWFKQQGAVLLAGGLLYLTYRKGLRGAIGYWALAAFAGPVMYAFLGPILFGDKMLYYTFFIPSQWTQFSTAALWRYLHFILDHFAYLAHLSVLWVIYRLIKGRTDIWDFGFPFAVAVGVLGVLESGSENNVFLLPGVWFILLGTAALWGIFEGRLHIFDAGSHVNQIVIISLIAGSFVLTFYNPLRAITPSGAWDSYRDFVRTIRDLDGIVYVPDVGQLQGGYRLPIPVHYVHLDDLVQEQSADSPGSSLPLEILAPLRDPSGNAFILTSTDLENYTLMRPIADQYQLVEDFGDRWSDLRALPGRFSGYSWPRYLYANSGNR
jgi:hypothetical protein